HLPRGEARLRRHRLQPRGRLRLRLRRLRLRRVQIAQARAGAGAPVTRRRILIAESLGIFRSGVRTLLDRESDFEIVVASDFGELSRAIEIDCPDIALVDLDLQPNGGIEAVSRLAKRCTCATIVWSRSEEHTSELQSRGHLVCR